MKISQNHDYSPVSPDFLHSVHQVLENKQFGFFSQTQNPSLENISKTAKALSKTPQQLLLIGIGGSSQGLKALVNAAHPDWVDENKIIFFDHIDQHHIERNLRKIKNISNSQACVISKSGETTEIQIILSLIESLLPANDFAELMRELLLICGKPASSLAKWGATHSMKFHSFPENVEGRFCVLSDAVLLPYQLLGGNLTQLLDGARDCLANSQIAAEFSRFAVNSFAEKRWITHFWFYQSNFFEFGLWLEQLWAESLGKSKKENLRTSCPYFCAGTNDQHSLLQQMAEGAADRAHVFFSFTGEKLKSIAAKSFANGIELNGRTSTELLEMYATSTHLSLKKSNPSLMINCEAPSARVLGGLFALFMLTVASIGDHLKINVYGQPGVEESKLLFRKLLSEKSLSNQH